MAPPPLDRPAGSFFHPVPDDSNNENDGGSSESMSSRNSNVGGNGIAPLQFDDEVSRLIQQRSQPPLASQPSTINGVPTEKATGFGKPKGEKGSRKKKKPSSSPSKPYVAIGPTAQVERINDPTQPQVDDQGYTLYTDEETGEKSRVFEALVDYPCVFTMKIVGENEGSFVKDIVALVAEACESDVEDVQHSTKAMGKWTSVTVQAPVENSEMLYTLYEKVDLDPRVKFKF
jgi:putative lipoic acid-binding regulatory protein